MEKNEEAGARQPSDGLFNVVYDPRFDRFFLEDEALHRERNCSLERKAISIPWEKWIVPPRSAASKDPRAQQEAAEDTLAQESVSSPIDQRQQPALVPALDFSSFQKVFENTTITPTVPEVQNKQKKTRIQDYSVHFKRTNQDVEKLISMGVANAGPNDEHQVKWNGEVIRVQFPGLPLESEESGVPVTERHNLDAHHDLLRGSRDEQWPGPTYELGHLMRIRAHADGLRKVNSACRFVAVSSSDSEVEPNIPQQESEEENDLMPVFFRDDRVLFHAKRRWFKGTVRRRIPSSDFYTIRADNGSLLDAVLASKMELLDEEELPYYSFRRGDRVLWIPDSQDAVTHPSRTTTSKSTRRRRERKTSDDELTYKAKIMQVHSLNRFDLLLRTGRVVTKVPYEQLRPRDASEFVPVSATTSRRR